MKRILFLICALIASAAIAAVTTGALTDRGFQLVRGTSNVGTPHATLQACLAAGQADSEARKSGANYRCVQTTAFSTTWKADAPPQPPPPPPPPADPHNGGVQPGDMPRYNPASIPAPTAGFAELRLRQSSEQPYRDPEGGGAFRTVCTRSHFNRDDSLVYPGQVGRAHLHMYFGNTGSDANSTPDSIRNTGNSTCRGGIANRSTYWVPAIIDTTDGSVIDMDHADVYYKTPWLIPNAAIQPIPPGLRIIAGDMMKTTKSPGFGGPEFRCSGKRETAIPVGCTSGTLEAHIVFPSCWDGQNLNAPDNKSHMAYPRGACPASHPVPLPEITYILHFPIPSGRNTSNWRLSSDNYVGGQGGNSMHGDWINGWDPSLPPVWTTRIINQGLSGGSHMIGDGRVMY